MESALIRSQGHRTVSYVQIRTFIFSCWSGILTYSYSKIVRILNHHKGAIANACTRASDTMVVTATRTKAIANLVRRATDIATASVTKSITDGTTGTAATPRLRIRTIHVSTLRLQTGKFSVDFYRERLKGDL